MRLSFVAGILAFFVVGAQPAHAFVEALIVGAAIIIAAVISCACGKD